MADALTEFAMNKNLLWIGLLCAALATGGCGYFAYLLSPEDGIKTVEPEFKDLPNHSVAVVIFANYAVRCEYPLVQLELASLIASQLQDGDKLKNVTVIDPRRIMKYQEENVNWDTLDKTALGRMFGADYVLLVSLVEFSTHEPGSLNVFKGTVVGEPRLYQTSKPEREACVWNCPAIRVQYPKEGAMGQVGTDDRGVRYAVESEFADRLVKKFYKHKEQE